MLQNIRDNSQGTIAKIIVGFIIVTFSLFGIESIVALGNSESAPATVNGVDIEEVEILRLISEQKNRFRQQFGDNYDESLFNDGFLRKSAIEQLIEQKVAVTQAQALGGYVSTESIDKNILSSPEFQQDGAFSSDRFRMLLRRSGLTPLSYRQILADQALISQLQLGTGLSDTALPFEVNRALALNSEEREFDYVVFDSAELKSDIELQDAEIEAYYESNQSRFMTEEKVSVAYVVLSKADIKTDIDVSEEALARSYDEYAAAQAENEERKASHVLIEINDERSEEEAKALASEISSKAKAGEDFAELAKTYSDDIGSKNVGGDLGFNTRGGFVTEFDDVLYTMSEGEVSEPVETEFGFHVIRLESIRSPELMTLEEKTAEFKAEIKAAEVEEIFAEKAEALAAAAFENETISDLVENTSLGLTERSTELFTRTQGKGVASNSAVRSSAFDEKVLVDKELSDIIEISADEIVVVGLKTHKQPVVKALAEVEATIKSQLLNDQSLALAEEKASTLVSALKAEEAVIVDWVTTATTVASANDVPSEINKAVFTLAKQPGEMISVKLPTGYAVARLVAVNAQPVTATDEDNARIAQSKANESFYVYRQWAKINSDIERSGS